MKVLLEIDEEEYIQRVMGNTQIGELLRRGKPINDHVTVTNGDVLKALFPNIDTSVSGEGDVIDVYNLGVYCQTFDTEWWNAEYEGDK